MNRCSLGLLLACFLTGCVAEPEFHAGQMVYSKLTGEPLQVVEVWMRRDGDWWYACRVGKGIVLEQHPVGIITNPTTTFGPYSLVHFREQELTSVCEE